MSILKNPAELTRKPKIWLCMIVRDEERVITRCIDSCPFISGVFLADTGSTDETGERASAACRVAGLSFQCVNHQWEDFGTNRSKMLAAVPAPESGGPDWLFLLDADEEFRGHSHDVFKAVRGEAGDAICIPMLKDGGELGQRVNLIRNVPGLWAYKYKVHETLMRTDGKPFITTLLYKPGDVAGGPHIITKQDGARSRNGREATLQADLRDLASAYGEDGNPRYLYYSGLVSFALGRHEDADGFLARFIDESPASGLQPDIDMLWHARLQRARIACALGMPVGYAQERFLEAYMADPSRCEPLAELALLFHSLGHYALAKIYAGGACMTGQPKSALAAIPAWRDWMAQDLLICALIELGEVEQAKCYAQQLTGNPSLPAERAKFWTDWLKAPTAYPRSQPKQCEQDPLSMTS